MGAFGLDILRAVSGVENKYQYNGKEKLDDPLKFVDPDGMSVATSNALGDIRNLLGWAQGAAPVV